MFNKNTNNYWYRVKNLQPCLRPQVDCQRQVIDDGAWYVLSEKSSKKQFRFNHVAFKVIGLLDGNKTIDEIWQITNGEEGISIGQSEIIQLLSQLHNNNLIAVDAYYDLNDLNTRREKQQENNFYKKWFNPLSMKFPLLNPDSLLEKHTRKTKFFFTKVFLILWLIIIVTALITFMHHWADISSSLSDKFFTVQNAFLIWLIFPCMKFFHEMGHGLSIKKWGGEINEVGVLFLVFMPFPYINASAANSFALKKHRIIVNAAGIMVDLFIASCALFVWLLIEPGILRAILFNVMIIGSVSSLLFNANPLLKYDGYYILSDFIERPNLYSRSNLYMNYLVDKYFFGLKSIGMEFVSNKEKKWCLIYGVLSKSYKALLMCLIALMLLEKFFVLGMLIVSWMAVMLIARPMYKKIIKIKSLPEFQLNPFAQSKHLILTLSVLLVLIFIIPLPMKTATEGIIWMPDNSLVKTNVAGEIVEILVKNHSIVKKGDEIIRISSPELKTQLRVLEAQRDELKHEILSYFMSDTVKKEQAEDELKKIEAELKHVKSKIRKLSVKSHASGEIIIPSSADVIGKYVHQGDVIAYVINSHFNLAKIIIPEESLSFINSRNDFELRRVGRSMESFGAHIDRETPLVLKTLPSAALGTQGGGQIVIDPSDKTGKTALNKFYVLDLKMDKPMPNTYIGSRLHVLIHHDKTTLYARWKQKIKQLFLRI